MKTVNNAVTSRLLRAVTLGAGLSLLAGAAPAQQATVIFFGHGTPSSCSPTAGSSLQVESSDGYRMASVPAGQRITLQYHMRVNHSASAAGFRYSNCTAGLAFTPISGAVYYLNSRVVKAQCSIEIVREDKSRETGLIVERSAGPPECRN